MSKVRSLLVAGCFILYSITACVDGGTGGVAEGNEVNSDTFDFVSMFVNYADTIIIPNYQRVSTLADDFSSPSGSLSVYCNSIGSSDEAQNFSDARDAWLGLMSAWQRTEMHQLGPVIANGGVLRHRVLSYANDTLNSCGVDQSIELASGDQNFNITSRALNQRGLGAIEYALFNTDLTHTCPTQIVETRDWNDRPEEQRKMFRCEFSRLAAADVSEAASRLLSEWSVTGGNYRSALIDPNNVAISLESLSDALFFMDLDVKDRKLGVPTGINDDCSQRTCPNLIESSYSQSSLANVRANLVAFQELLEGGEGLGFDDIISLAGVPELNGRFRTNIQKAIDIIDGPQNSLSEQVVAIGSSAAAESECVSAFSNPDTIGAYPACNLVGQLKIITDDLKIDFIAAVAVDLPERAQSDND